MSLSLPYSLSLSLASRCLSLTQHALDVLPVTQCGSLSALSHSHFDSLQTRYLSHSLYLSLLVPLSRPFLASLSLHVSLTHSLVLTLPNAMALTFPRSHLLSFSQPLVVSVSHSLSLPLSTRGLSHHPSQSLVVSPPLPPFLYSSLILYCRSRLLSQSPTRSLSLRHCVSLVASADCLSSLYSRCLPHSFCLSFTLSFSPSVTRLALAHLSLTRCFCLAVSLVVSLTSLSALSHTRCIPRSLSHLSLFVPLTRWLSLNSFPRSHLLSVSHSFSFSFIVSLTR